MAAIVLSLGLSGCAKEDPANALDVDMNRTATINGTILVNADITKAPADQKYSAPAITNESFIVTVPYSALNSGAAGTYVLPKDKITYSSGKYVITVPVGVSNTQVTIKISDFTGSLKKTVSGADKTVDVIWKASAKQASKTVVAGETAYMSDILLDGNSTSDYQDVKTDGSSYQ